MMPGKTIWCILVAISIHHYTTTVHRPELPPTVTTLHRLQRKKATLMHDLKKAPVTDLQYRNISLALKIAEEKDHQSEQIDENDLNHRIKIVEEQIHALQKLLFLKQKHSAKSINRILQNQYTLLANEA